MKVHHWPGFFIAVEGLDGSGSDEIVKALKKKLRKEKGKVIVVKEPSGGPVGLLIKKFLQPKKKFLSALMLEYLFAADREWLMKKRIIPALKKKRLVISDRSLWSSIAYRSLELPIHWLMEINKQFFIPDLTFFIDVPPQICAARIKRGEDEVQIYTEENRLAQIQDGYHWIFNKYPYWFRIVDGQKDQKEVVKEVIADLRRRSGFKRIKN